MKKGLFGFIVILCCSMYNNLYAQQNRKLERLMDSITKTRSSDRPMAIKFCLEAETYAKELGDYEKLDEIYYTLGTVYSWINHEISVKYSKMGIQLAKENHRSNESARFYVLLGKVSVSQENFDHAIQFYLLADSIFVLEESQYDIAWVKGNLGHALLEKGEYAKAVDQLEKAIEINKSLGKNELNVAELINLGACRLKLNQLNIAIKLFEEAYTLSLETNDLYGCATAKMMLAEYHHSIKKYSVAINIAKEAEEFAKESDNYYLLKSIYLQLYESYSGLSNYKNSLEYLELYNATSDSLEGGKHNNLIADLQSTLTMEKQNFEHELLKKEKANLLDKEKIQSSRNRLLLILLVSSVLILTALIVIFIFRNKGAKLKQRLNENTLKMKNREITNLAIYMKQRGMFIELIRNDLKDIRKTKNEITKNNLITELFVKVGQYARIDNKSEQMKEHIEETTEDFIARLTVRFPNLTSKEKRMAQLLHMKLSSKEIAILLNIAPHSVDTNRYRLRKKLNLRREENLSSIFTDI